MNALENESGVEHFRAVVTADNNKLIHDLFKSIDTNGDGVIDMDEMKEAEADRKIKHEKFLSLMEEAQSRGITMANGLTMAQFCELATSKFK